MNSSNSLPAQNILSSNTSFSNTSLPDNQQPSLPNDLPSPFPSNLAPPLPDDPPPPIPTESPPPAPCESPPPAPSKSPPPAPCESPPLVPCESPPLVPCESPPPATCESPLSPRESPPPAHPETPPTVSFESLHSAPINTSCESKEPNPLESIETRKIKSVPSSFEIVSILPNSNIPMCTNLSIRDPRLLKRISESSHQSSDDEAVQPGPALPKLISKSPAQVDHNTSRYKPCESPPPAPCESPPPAPCESPPPVPCESPPPVPCESPPLATCKSPLPPRESPPPAPPGTPPPVPSESLPSAPINTSCESIETQKIESVPSSFEIVSILPNSNIPMCTNLSICDPRLLKRISKSSHQSSNDEAVQPGPALPKLISKSPAQVDHNTSRYKPCESPPHAPCESPPHAPCESPPPAPCESPPSVPCESLPPATCESPLPPRESSPPAPPGTPPPVPSESLPSAPINTSCESNEPNPLESIKTRKIESVPSSFEIVSILPNSNIPMCTNLSICDPRLLKRIAESSHHSNDEAVQRGPALLKLISKSPAQVDHNPSRYKPCESPPPAPCESPPPATCKSPLPPRESSPPAPPGTPPPVPSESLPSAPINTSCESNEPNPLESIETRKIESVPSSFEIVSILPNSNMCTNLSIRDPRLLKRIAESFHQSSNDDAVLPGSALPKLISKSPAQFDHNTSRYKPVQSSAVCNMKSTQFITALHLPTPLTQSNLPLQSSQHNTRSTANISALSSALPTSLSMKAASGLSTMNLSAVPVFVDPPPSGIPQSYSDFAVQKNSTNVQASVQTSNCVSSNILQENPEISADNSRSQTYQASIGPSDFKDSVESCSANSKKKCSPISQQYHFKDKCNTSVENCSTHQMESSTISKNCSKFSPKETKHHAEEKHFSLEEKHVSPRDEKLHGSSQDGRHRSSYKVRRHSSSHKDERYNLSHEEERLGSFLKGERLFSLNKDERHSLFYKNDRCHSSHWKEKFNLSHKIDRHHSIHREKRKEKHSSHRDSKHHSSKKLKERHSLQNEKKRPSSLKKEKPCRDSMEESCDKICENGGNDNIINDVNVEAELENTNLKANDTKSSLKNLCTDSKSNKTERKKDLDSKIKSEKDSSNLTVIKRASSVLSRRDRSKKSRSLKYSPSKRKIKENRNESPKKEKRSLESASRKRKSSKLHKERRSRSKSHHQSSDKKKQAYHRAGNVSTKPRARRVKRRRSVTPKDLPCLTFKAYKYITSTVADEYYCPKTEDSKEILAKDPLKELQERFRSELVDRANKARALKPKYDPPKRKTKLRKPKSPKIDSDSESSSSCEQSSSEEEDTAMEELERKKKHPDRLHIELWFNDPKEMNDGPLCRCSAKARRTGIRHGIYVGEDHLPLCNPYSNNSERLHHYRITMTPTTNFLTNNPTTIRHNGFKYRFEGFSMFSHEPLPQLPNCKVIRFNYEYTILYIEEEFPKNFTVQGLELFSQYLLTEILELVDLNWKAYNDDDGCPRFHFMPRFTRELTDGGKEILAHCHVLDYLLKENKVLIPDEKLPEVLKIDEHKWQDLADEVKGMIVTCPGMKPSSIRVDQLDREQCARDTDKSDFPVIVHFGVRPPQLSYAGNPHYQKAWRDYVKYRHLLANKPKVKYADKHKLIQKESRLQAMRMENDLKRDVTVVIKSKNFYKTGIMSDIIQHAMLLPVLVCHLRFHQSLTHLEDKLGYEFKDRFLLQLALTHPSYRENFGTNPDHARNSLTNCGLRQPQYGDRRIHYMNTRKRGINTLINIMSRFGSRKETISRINHNERLEFLGDAVVEFLSSIHLFYMFPDLEEGGLATYRAAIVQNQHLAVLSKKLELDRFMLYAHGSDLCHDLELRHAMANCFEALMGALFLDNGIEIADKVFSKTLFSEPDLLEVWKNFSPHPLQEQEPDGDRKWIESVPLLQRLHEFEETIGIEFNHIRLLARALTHRSLGYNNLTLGSNQRLEFLGDTVLQLVASEYLYKFFPEHHEGHLSLLRSSLVNNRTQAVVCADLGMVEYAIYPYSKVELKPKDKADLLEAFLGALYVDKDLGYCRKFCEVCFFPRLQDFIMNQDWNDPKSKLQQCCLTLRSMDGGEPDIPTYKVIECKGPTNTRVYSVAVYFQGNRLAVGSGHSIQQAEMDAASNALAKSKDLFPQLRHQRRAIERSLKQGPPKKRKSSAKDSL